MSPRAALAAASTALSLGIFAAPVRAQPTPHVARAFPSASLEAPPVETLTVLGNAPLRAASSQTVRDRDLQLRPRTRPADLFEVAPGLIVVRHAGGGKANQYFLRGFDADHGTDLALSLDDVPINMVSHAHGQGYADPHFIIPELVARSLHRSRELIRLCS